jgi:Fur family ferric uptake transcriptional regulator
MMFGLKGSSGRSFVQPGCKYGLFVPFVQHSGINYLCTMTNEERLRNHGLRVTDTRMAVLDLLQRSSKALSQADVERALPEQADRVTLFRVLQAFEENGLAHRVQDTKGVARYASCAPGCSTHKHHDVHAHFRCTDCGDVYCLESVTLPKVSIPKGFTLKESHLQLEGSCKACA